MSKKSNSRFSTRRNVRFRGFKGFAARESLYTDSSSRISSWNRLEFVKAKHVFNPNDLLTGLVSTSSQSSLLSDKKPLATSTPFSSTSAMSTLNNVMNEPNDFSNNLGDDEEVSTRPVSEQGDSEDSLKRRSEQQLENSTLMEISEVPSNGSNEEQSASDSEEEILFVPIGATLTANNMNNANDSSAVTIEPPSTIDTVTHSLEDCHVANDTTPESTVVEDQTQSKAALTVPILDNDASGSTTPQLFLDAESVLSTEATAEEDEFKNGVSAVSSSASLVQEEVSAVSSSLTIPSETDEEIESSMVDHELESTEDDTEVDDTVDNNVSVNEDDTRSAHEEGVPSSNDFAQHSTTSVTSPAPLLSPSLSDDEEDEEEEPLEYSYSELANEDADDGSPNVLNEEFEFILNESIDGETASENSEDESFSGNRFAALQNDFTVYDYFDNYEPNGSAIGAAESSVDEEEEPVPVTKMNRKQRKLLLRQARKDKKKAIKSATISGNYDFDDDDLEEVLNYEHLQEQWLKDRSKKAGRRRERELLRAEGLLGKKKKNKKINKKLAKAGDALVSANGASYLRNPSAFYLEIHKKIKEFLVSDKQEISFPPMPKKLRKDIHNLAYQFALKSSSQGQGQQRFLSLYKTRATGFIDTTVVQSMEFSSKTTRLLRKSASTAKVFEGQIVGENAPEISQGNRGRRLLEGMGWDAGRGLGTAENEGVRSHLQAVVKLSRFGLGV
ncbi:R3H and G-patch domain-containing protein [Schizosaccharomyces japonicus yFS275]|uniref:Protein SQS1 n=1 Tax=Schizosaccharomyces japonicus (strain yFS275 / FY16936) TaxID=402676 RepID=B6K1Z4_SCHJY|nr:R3H and G-patch domain-containing protein [Schizosaccharomyces japonicus yFS275]EEB07175.1 R3H and G-patch domain-containing protein [Schizosaccharomyces japonicus yFS275]